MNKRIIYSDNGTLIDVSAELNNFHSGSFTSSIVAAEDAIYIGSNLPFNHFKVNVGATPNAETSTMTTQLWDGKSWADVAELIDESSTSGATLALDGFVTFTPNKQTNWKREDTVSSSGSENVTGLGDITIYDKYWIKVTFSADLTADAVIGWIGQIFSSDDDLSDEFPDFALTDMMSAFQSGKTDWENQHYTAAKVIVKDLIKKKVITDGDQILVKEDLTLASVQKVASIIYNALGDDYLDQFKAANIEYKIRLSNAYVKADKNSNARLDVKEMTPAMGILYR